jgi:hypothetical protein
LRSGEFGCGENGILRDIELTDGALWLKPFPACSDIFGTPFDRGALYDVFVEHCPCFVRSLRTSLGVSERALMVKPRCA